MKKEKWNRFEWQGRSKKQVESTNIIVHYTILTTIVIGLIYILFNFLSNL
jgi:uncharacterized membrane protein YidH (DUF202 family)